MEGEEADVAVGGQHKGKEDDGDEVGLAMGDGGKPAGRLTNSLIR